MVSVGADLVVMEVRLSLDRRPLVVPDALPDALPSQLQPTLYLRDRASLRQVLRVVERHGNPGATWLWLDRPEDVYTATRELPEIRCTLLRPGGGTMPARRGCFLDAQRSGARGVSVPRASLRRS